MNILKTTLAAAAVALSASMAFAQTPPTPAPTTPAAPAATAKPAEPAPKKAGTKAAERSDISKKCSADADAKKLHGKERKTFREACMKDAAKAAEPAKKAEPTPAVKAPEVPAVKAPETPKKN